MATTKKLGFSPTEKEKLFDKVMGHLVHLNTLANKDSDSLASMSAREDLIAFGVQLESAGLADVMTAAFRLGEESDEPQVTLIH